VSFQTLWTSDSGDRSAAGPGKGWGSFSVCVVRDELAGRVCWTGGLGGMEIMCDGIYRAQPYFPQIGILDRASRSIGCLGDSMTRDVHL
jgi:hypothetical protein